MPWTSRTTMRLLLFVLRFMKLMLSSCYRFRGPLETSSRTTALRISLPRNLHSFATPSTTGRQRRLFYGTSSVSCSQYRGSPPSRVVRSEADYRLSSSAVGVFTVSYLHGSAALLFIPHGHSTRSHSSDFPARFVPYTAHPASIYVYLDEINDD